ncbi:unnamed protein product [Sphagnum jensenii]|uniref:Cyclic nucleotide-binding domain-containing protein n=1 Tax=Sphagnum jensenii TaxID=128206 RepID=A0ABP0VG51_9BRYO
MYLLKSGVIRLFLKKGDSNVEIDTVRAGQVLGELAFLDGNPRSLSGEALTHCELVEISGPMFMDVLNQSPPWFKILLKTVVGRLRAANKRIRQLEAANVSVDYSESSGKRSQAYEYLSLGDFAKICMVFVYVGTRYGQATARGTEIIDDSEIIHLCNRTMGLPVAKVSSALDLLVDSELAETVENAEKNQIYLKDLEYLSVLIQSLDEESGRGVDNRTEVSARGLVIMALISKQLAPMVEAGNLEEITVLDVGPAASGGAFKGDDLAPAFRSFQNSEAAELKEAWIERLKKGDYLNECNGRSEHLSFFDNDEIMDSKEGDDSMRSFNDIASGFDGDQLSGRENVTICGQVLLGGEVLKGKPAS